MMSVKLVIKREKIKSNLILFFIFILLIGCKENKKQTIQKKEVEKSLVFKIDLQNYGVYDIGKYTKKWENSEKGNVLYFDVFFKKLKKERIKIKTNAVATNMPIIIKYSKGKENKEILEIVQQFNTIYSDSIIFRKENIADFPVVDQAFRIGYQHNGTDVICQLKVNQHHDTIDISNQKTQNCIEKKR